MPEKEWLDAPSETISPGFNYGSALTAAEAAAVRVWVAGAGVFPTVAALVSAHPPAISSSLRAFVGASPPYARYVCDGAQWVQDVGPVLSYRASSTVAAPLSTTVCSSTNGAISTPVPISIPAGVLFPGSKISLQVKARRTGNAQSEIFYVRLGTSGGSTDAQMAIGTFTTASNPLDGVFFVDVDITGASTVLSTSQRFLQNVGTNTSFGEVTSAAIDTASPMFISFGYTTVTTSADAFLLLSYDVQVYQ